MTAAELPDPQPERAPVARQTAKRASGCTARLAPNGRVTRLTRLSLPAARLIRIAARIAADRRRTARHAGASYVAIGVSTYPADLEQIDRVVALLQVAGIHGVSRSWLIRAAIRALDVEALIKRELASR